ncbi:MAG: septum formation initiator family protein [Candidatus Liptonbacteria bacterium]|nr:septum formation initiator family protein [Candidatus Liptonbacteria bacterium]
MARLAIIMVLVLLIVLMSYQNFNFFRDYRTVKKEFSELKSQFDDLKLSNSKIEEDVRYYENEDNLEKEARSQLNYKDPGEKLIIVVPKE